MLSRLPRLERLSIDDASDKYAEWISQLTCLTRLYLHASYGLSAAGLAALSSLSALQELELKGPKTVYNRYEFSFISNLSSLGSLTLVSWRSLTKADVCQWTRLSALHKLYVSKTHVDSRTVASIARLPGLCDLTFYETEVCDEGARHLTALTALSRLEFSEGAISKAAGQMFNDIPGLKLHLEPIDLCDLSYLDDIYGY